ncbi:MAG: SUMF1/EgtB/PvdO family nonheme iron enzyme, partial [Opitutaceae bacterium]
METPHKTCCAPGRTGDGGGASKPPAPGFERIRAGSLAGMKLIPGGEFIMGTDGSHGFPADGEGPAHSVVLEPFHIDAT